MPLGLGSWGLGRGEPGFAVSTVSTSPCADAACLRSSEITGHRCAGWPRGGLRAVVDLLLLGRLLVSQLLLPWLLPWVPLLLLRCVAPPSSRHQDSSGHLAAFALRLISASVSASSFKMPRGRLPRVAHGPGRGATLLPKARNSFLDCRYASYFSWTSSCNFACKISRSCAFANALKASTSSLHFAVFMAANCFFVIFESDASLASSQSTLAARYSCPRATQFGPLAAFFVVKVDALLVCPLCPLWALVVGSRDLFSPLQLALLADLHVEYATARYRGSWFRAAVSFGKAQALYGSVECLIRRAIGAKHLRRAIGAKHGDVVRPFPSLHEARGVSRDHHFEPLVHGFAEEASEQRATRLRGHVNERKWLWLRLFTTTVGYYSLLVA